VEFQLNSDKLNLLMVHGSPRKINEYLFEDRDEKSLSRILTDAGAHIMCFGHTHKPYHRILKQEDGTYRHAINIGSVGKPKDGDPTACYAIITLTESSNSNVADSIMVDFVRVPYDIEMAARAVEDSPLPNGYAAMLRQAF